MKSAVKKTGTLFLNPYVWWVSLLWSQFKWIWYNEIFWWFQWFSDFRSWDGLWLDYRCALAKMLLEVLDTEGCISCSRKLRSRHGYLDQGFDHFEGNGTTRHLGKLRWWCHCFFMLLFGPNSIPMQMKFNLLICQSQEEINTDDLLCLCESFWRLKSHMLKWLEVKNITPDIVEEFTVWAIEWLE